MDSVVEIIVSAVPWLAGAVDTAQVVITAIPAYAGHLIDTACVTITALPQLVAGLPVWLYGVIGSGFLAWAWSELT